MRSGEVARALQAGTRLVLPPLPGDQAAAREEGRLQEKLLTILLDSKEKVVDCVENEKPFIAGYFCNAPGSSTPWTCPGTC
jgi:hypothetical protein